MNIAGMRQKTEKLKICNKDVFYKLSIEKEQMIEFLQIRKAKILFHQIIIIQQQYIIRSKNWFKNVNFVCSKLQQKEK